MNTDKSVVPAISVIIPCRGEPAVLLDCLRSLSRQTCRVGFEVVVVDSNGCSRTTDLAERTKALAWTRAIAQLVTSFPGAQLVCSLAPLPAGELAFMPSCNLAMSRSTFDELGGFSSVSIGEDILLTSALARLRCTSGPALLYVTGMKIRHSGRRDFRAFMAHHHSFGVARGQYGLRTSKIEQRLNGSAFYVPALVGKRLLYITMRTARWSPLRLLILLTLMPLIVCGVYSWALGVGTGRRFQTIDQPSRRIKECDQTATPRASVIVPAFNVADYIEPALQSLFDQTISDFEIIVIDDGSTDDSWRLLQRIEEQRKGLCPALTILRQENAGPSAARNAGIELASADLIGFLDGDDLWHADKLEQHLQLLDSRPEIDLSFSWFSSIDSDGEAGGWTGKPDTISFRSLVINNSIMTSLVVARREALLQAGGFDERLRSHVDFDLWLRVANLLTANLAAIESVLVKQRTRPGQITADWRGMEQSWLQVMENARASGREQPGGAVGDCRRNDRAASGRFESIAVSAGRFPGRQLDAEPQASAVNKIGGVMQLGSV